MERMPVDLGWIKAEARVEVPKADGSYSEYAVSYFHPPKDGNLFIAVEVCDEKGNPLATLFEPTAEELEQELVALVGEYLVDGGDVDSLSFKVRVYALPLPLDGEEDYLLYEEARSLKQEGGLSRKDLIHFFGFINPLNLLDTPGLGAVVKKIA